MSISGLALVFALIGEWKRQEKELYEWKALKTETDLRFLKNQLRPHFLFNSINNIYSIAVEHEDKSAPLLLEISQMLRYLIYKTDQEQIPLPDEVHFLNSLIKLYSLRLEFSPFDQISRNSNIEGYEIPPLILLPFIENIFKHGDFEQTDKTWLLRLSVSNGVLRFETQNPMLRDLNKESMSGIGLSNLRSRLDLLFPNSYKLIAEEMNDSYRVSLELVLHGK